jgi:hypothetical protein
MDFTLNLTSEIYSLFFKVMEFGHYNIHSFIDRAVWTSFTNIAVSMMDPKPLPNADLT